MLIELDGIVGQVSYRNGGWRAEVTLRQPGPNVSVTSESGKILNCDSFRDLGTFDLAISPEDAKDLAVQPAPHLKFLVEIAKL